MSEVIPMACAASPSARLSKLSVAKLCNVYLSILSALPGLNLVQHRELLDGSELGLKFFSIFPLRIDSLDLDLTTSYS